MWRTELQTRVWVVSCALRGGIRRWWGCTGVRYVTDNNNNNNNNDIMR